MVNNSEVNKYRFVESVTKAFIRGKCAQTVISARVLGGIIRCYQYDWVGYDQRFYSLVVPCTEATVYKFPDILRTNSRSFEQVLESNLRVFNTKEEWQSNKWTEGYVRQELSALEKKFDAVRAEHLNLKHHSVQSIIMHLQPTIGMTIWYQDSEKKMSSFTVWINAITTIEVDDRYIGELLTALGIESRVHIVQCAPALALEEVSSFDTL